MGRKEDNVQRQQKNVLQQDKGKNGETPAFSSSQYGDNT